MTGTELQRRRKALGLTQAALAEYVGAHPNTVAKWERGEQGVRHPAMLEIALGVLEHGVYPEDAPEPPLPKDIDP